MDKNDDIGNKFRDQANMLKEKLNQSYQDIQRLVKAQKQLQDQNNDAHGLFDTEDTATKTKKSVQENSCQTDIDLQ